MTHPSYEDMERIMAAGRVAYNYAWEHFDELNSRKAVYTLYGPKSDFLGAASPSHFTSTAQRHLSTSTRRKSYTVYELDENFQVLRVTKIKNYHEIECIYHLFELDGTIYGRSFWHGEKRGYIAAVECVRFLDGRPAWYASVRSKQLYMEIYEYGASGEVNGRDYFYRPDAECTRYGLPLCWDAPFGTPASPVSFVDFKDAPKYIDFASWFYPEKSANN